MVNIDLYPMICTQEIIHISCGSRQREDSIFRCTWALKSYSWRKHCEASCVHLQNFGSRQSSEGDNTILETT